MLERKNQMKIRPTDKEWLHSDCIEQVNTGRGGKLGICGSISGQGPTKARIFDENMDGQMYCDIFSGKSKRLMAKPHD